MPKKSDQLTVRISAELKAELAEIADADERSVAWIVHKALEEFVRSRRSAQKRQSK